MYFNLVNTCNTIKSNRLTHQRTIWKHFFCIHVQLADGILHRFVYAFIKLNIVDSISSFSHINLAAFALLRHKLCMHTHTHTHEQTHTNNPCMCGYNLELLCLYPATQSGFCVALRHYARRPPTVGKFPRNLQRMS